MKKSEFSVHLGNNIRTIRNRRGLSSEQLARRLADQGVILSGRAVRNYENGDRDCSVELMVQFALALDCSLQTLLAGLAPRVEDNDRTVEYKLLTPYEHSVFARMATEWTGDRHALIIIDDLYMSLTPKYRRESILALLTQTELAITDGIISRDQLPEGFDYLEEKWRELYKKK